MEPADFSIQQLQSWMQGMLVHHLPVNSSADPVAVDSIVNASQRLSAVKHLDIYRHSYIARLRACMQSQFSALAYALGNDLFGLFADQYLDTYPSRSYTLNTLGEKFADFLQETRPDADRDKKEMWPDFMIGLARFEYALSEIFDVHADENYSVATGDTPDGLLSPAPVLQLFHHQFPICRYYLEYTQKKEPELPFPEECYCAVCRRNYKLGLFTIRESQYYFLKLMQQGCSVEEAKHEMVKTFSLDAAEMQRVWPVWKMNFIESGFFVNKKL